MKKRFIKAIVVVLAMLFNKNELRAQKDCDCKVLVVASLGAKADISGEAKIGLWQNTGSSGVTLFGGIMTNVPESEKGRDPESEQGLNTQSGGKFHDRGFIELGYRFRINKKIFSHSMIGATVDERYLGTELLYQADNTLLLGLNYKRHLPGIVLYIHF